MPLEPTYLGVVESVSGACVTVNAARETLPGLTFIEGVAYRIGQVGAFVRIPIGYLDLFGIVTEVGAGAVPERLVDEQPHGHRWMTVELIGEGERGRDFQRGLSQSPAVGDPVHLVTVRDLERIYGRHDEPRYVKVGRHASAESIPALVNVDKLVTRHSAVLGATGSGKSTTVASLLNALSDRERYPSARIVVFDIHGEYANAFRERAAVFCVNRRPKPNEQLLHVPYWAMNLEELLPVTFGDVADDATRGALQEKLLEYKRASIAAHTAAGRNLPSHIDETSLSADSPVPFSLRQLWFELVKLVKGTHRKNDGQDENTFAYECDASGQPIQPGNAEQVIPPHFRPMTQAAGDEKIYQAKAGQNLKLSRNLDALASRLRDPRLNFLFRPGPWDPNLNGVPEQDLDTLLRAWLGSERPVVVLDLSGVPVSILNAIIGTLLRILYDALFWARDRSEGGRERPLLVVLEEAHLYLNKESNDTAAAAVRRIAKEGRKYGIGAMVVSQRPSEVDDTILTQCGTLFAMRMSNPADRAHVSGAVTDNLQGFLGNLPILRTGEAVIVGEAVHLPMRALIEPPPPDRRPDSGDPVIFGGTFNEKTGERSVPGGWDRKLEPGDYAGVVEAWRRQESRPARPQTDISNI